MLKEVKAFCETRRQTFILQRIELVVFKLYDGVGRPSTRRRITRAWIGDERDNQMSSCSASDRGRRRQRFFYEGNKGKIVLHRGPGGTAEQSARFSEAGLVLQKIRLFITVFPDRIFIKPHKMRELVHQRDLHFSRQFGPLGKILF